MDCDAENLGWDEERSPTTNAGWWDFVPRPTLPLTPEIALFHDLVHRIVRAGVLGDAHADRLAHGLLDRLVVDLHRVDVWVKSLVWPLTWIVSPTFNASCVI